MIGSLPKLAVVGLAALGLGGCAGATTSNSTAKPTTPVETPSPATISPNTPEPTAIAGVLGDSSQLGATDDILTLWCSLTVGETKANVLKLMPAPVGDRGGILGSKLANGTSIAEWDPSPHDTLLTVFGANQKALYFLAFGNGLVVDPYEANGATDLPCPDYRGFNGMPFPGHEYTPNAKPPLDGITGITTFGFQTPLDSFLSLETNNQFQALVNEQFPPTDSGLQPKEFLIEQFDFGVDSSKVKLSSTDPTMLIGGVTSDITFNGPGAGGSPKGFSTIAVATFDKVQYQLTCSGYVNPYSYFVAPLTYHVSVDFYKPQLASDCTGLASSIQFTAPKAANLFSATQVQTISGDKTITSGTASCTPSGCTFSGTTGNNGSLAFEQYPPGQTQASINSLLSSAINNATAGTGPVSPVTGLGVSALKEIGASAVVYAFYKDSYLVTISISSSTKKGASMDSATLALAKGIASFF